jgi:hypothetical protein
MAASGRAVAAKLERFYREKCNSSENVPEQRYIEGKWRQDRLWRQGRSRGGYPAATRSVRG